MVIRIVFFGLLAFFFFWGTSHGGKGPVVGDLYRSLYPLSSASQKLVANDGRGPASLYGTRNVRAVLNGVYYRGGANNAFYNPPRDNSNPLPNEGLKNLCEEGFSHAVYLYNTNYASAPRSLKCRDRQGGENTIQYLQISPLAFRESELKELLSLIYSHVRDPRLGPIYDHCWNGWHASGYVAASSLQQFCGFTAEEAVAYWNLNTDGNSQGSSNDRIRARIRAFRPFPSMTLTGEEKASLCPKPNNLQFNAR